MTDPTQDEPYMRRALEIAGRGRGLTSPGAMVGALVVKDGEILGEGCYTWDGLYHAEILALGMAGERALGSTLYVTLEPCSHQGRTPPCADQVARAGVARVVAAMADPDPKVNGAGLARLRELGVEVSCPLLEREARRTNEAFLVSLTRGRPFGVLKVAMTLDGKIATASGDSRWITSEESRARVHLLRHSVDALLTGSGTILSDDPALTDRSDRPRRRPLLRAVIDRRGRLTPRFRVFGGPGAIVYTRLPHPDWLPPTEVVIGPTDLGDVFRDLGARQVRSVMLECGPDLAFDAVSRGFVDKIVAFVAPRILGGREVPAFGSSGVRSLSEAVGIEDWEFEAVGPDVMITGYVHRSD
jgi:diaminohydroxyphosphoribosylaminopyrimidine deaminase/5-amino-6-(5-phosphoribosylamino)uracil reductase